MVLDDEKMLVVIIAEFAKLTNLKMGNQYVASANQDKYHQMMSMTGAESAAVVRCSAMEDLPNIRIICSR